MMETIPILLLLVTANAAPVVMQIIFHERFGYPLDGNRTFIDGRPVFGRTKTVRGLLASLGITTLMASAMGISAAIGALIAIAAMTGDLLSSFIKRRLAIPSGKMALGLDQIPESILPLLAVRIYFELSWSDISIIMAAFFILESVLSSLFIKSYEKT